LPARSRSPRKAPECAATTPRASASARRAARRRARAQQPCSRRPPRSQRRRSACTRAAPRARRTPAPAPRRSPAPPTRPAAPAARPPSGGPAAAPRHGRLQVKVPPEEGRESRGALRDEEALDDRVEPRTRGQVPRRQAPLGRGARAERLESRSNRNDPGAQWRGPEGPLDVREARWRPGTRGRWTRRGLRTPRERRRIGAPGVEPRGHRTVPRLHDPRKLRSVAFRRPNDALSRHLVVR